MLSVIKRNGEAFSRESTVALRGLMAVAIYLGHVLPACNLAYGESVITLFSSNAYLFVGTFFMLSGYGLFSSYRYKPQYIKHFISKRFAPLYIKNGILILAYSLFDIVNKEAGGRMLSALLLMDTCVTYGWYIQVTLSLYLIFWIVLRWCASSDLVKIAMLTVACLLYVVGCVVLNVSDVWYRCIFCFPLGCAFAQWKQRLVSILRDNQVFAVVFLIVLAVFVGLQISISVLEWARILLMCATSLMSACLMGLILMRVSIRSMVLQKIGAYSFELYIAQGMGIRIASWWLTGGWMLAAATFTTVVMSMLFKQMFRKVDELLR